MSPIQLRGSDTVVRNEGLLAAEVDGELVAMSVENGVVYGLNAVGARVWALIEEPRTIDSLCAQLMGEFEVDAEVCARDVTELLAQLYQEKLITVRNPPGH